MNRKAIFFSASVILILAFSNIQGGILLSSKTLPQPNRIDGRDLAAIPPVEETIGFFQGRIKANPLDAVSYQMLAGQFVRQARETGDAANYERAEEALIESLRLVSGYRQAKASLAAVYYARHDFLAALDLAGEVYEADPRITEALVTIGDAELALGRYREAEAAYRALIEKENTPPVLARLAALEELKGNPQQALDLMRRAAGDALRAGGTKESVAWYLLRVGDLYSNRGQYREAGEYYQAALRVFDRYSLALAGLGKVRAAQGRYDEAIDYYQQAIDRVPQPAFLAALGDLYILTGNPEQALVQYRTVAYIGRLAGINRQIYNRELANFYSDHDFHVKEALELALAELESRKDIYGYDAAAWAHYRNGNFEEAQTLMDQAMALGTRDARLYYHAGLIEHALGNDKSARQFLDEALAINPHFSILSAIEIRRTLATLR